jgi:hypothetical protein
MMAESTLRLTTAQIKATPQPLDRNRPRELYRLFPATGATEAENSRMDSSIRSRSISLTQVKAVMPFIPDTSFR